MVHTRILLRGALLSGACEALEEFGIDYTQERRVDLLMKLPEVQKRTDALSRRFEKVTVVDVWDCD